MTEPSVSKNDNPTPTGGWCTSGCKDAADTALDIEKTHTNDTRIDFLIFILMLGPG